MMIEALSALLVSMGLLMILETFHVQNQHSIKTNLQKYERSSSWKTMSSNNFLKN